MKTKRTLPDRFQLFHLNLGAKTIEQCRAVVAKHGLHGQGDAFRSRYVEGCTGEYVRQCAVRALEKNPNDRQAKDVLAAVTPN